MPRRKPKWKEVADTTLNPIARWFKRHIWRFFSRRRHSVPGAKLDGSDASDMISQDLAEDSNSVTFTWSNGFPVVKRNTTYWLVIKTEEPTPADSQLMSKSFIPRKSGSFSKMKMQFKNTAIPPCDIRAEIWTDREIDKEKEAKCKNPSS